MLWEAVFFFKVVLLTLKTELIGGSVRALWLGPGAVLVAVPPDKPLWPEKRSPTEGFISPVFWTGEQTVYTTH